MKKSTLLASTILLITTSELSAQGLQQCGANVPFFQIDLTGQPDGVWLSPSHSRLGNCCGTVFPDRCNSFEIILDTGAAMINFEIVEGAIPAGSMFYQIGCGPQIPVGEPICITGPGPHQLTFCKPGNNENVYQVTSVPKPIFPKDDTTRIGCSLPVSILGLEGITITSVFPGSVGQYNSYLSCLNCTSPSFSPGLGAPAYIDYKICGNPIAAVCGYVVLCDTVRLYIEDELQGSVSPNPAFFCSGGSGVLLTGFATGGDANYSFIWRNSSNVIVGTNPTYNATAQGTYTVEISDGLNSPTCPSDFFSIPVTVGLPPVVSAGPDDTVCASSPEAFLNGSITNATGGIWTGGTGTFDPNNTTLFASYTPSVAEIAAGFVELTLTSTGAGGGCTNAPDVVKIFISADITVTVIPPTLDCYGSAETATASATGGIGAFSYSWSTGAITSSVTVGAGTYSVIVTDAAGCFGSSSFSLTTPSALGISLSSTDISVDGATDGTATASPTGGTLPYSYLWNNGQTTQTSTSLGYGVYTVTVTDANGCTISGSVVVNKPSCLGFDVTSTGTNVDCNGNSNGTATANGTGGTAPYSYSWNTVPAQTTQTAVNLSAGIYSILLTDANGCVNVDNITIAEPTALTNTMTHTDNTISGGTSGTATVNPSGGTGPYTYLWNAGAITSTITGLSAGIYTVVITDANGCTLNDGVSIADPQCSNFSNSVNAVSVSCNGGTNGSANVVIAHGTPPYSILWSTGQTTSSISGLSAGNYSVTITDQINCITFSNYTITEPSPLSIGLAPTNVICNGAADGTIDLSITGGTFPYTFVWTKASVVIATVEDLINLGPGTYSVTVTDANGCTISGSAGITQPSKITAVITETDITCAGGNNGTVDLTPSGGQPPYTYLWTFPGGSTQTTQDLSGLTAGLYTLDISDANGCTVSSELETYLDQPDSVKIIYAHADCPAPGGNTTNVLVDTISGGNNGIYQVSFDGGISWQVAGDYTATLPVDSTYLIYAQDNNGCISSFAYSLIVNPVVEIDTVLFNPCISAGTTNINITVNPSGGNGGPYQVSTNNGSTFNAAGTYTISVPVGTNYQVVIKDGKGCLSSAYLITVPSPFTSSAVLTQQVSCLGGNDATVNLTVNGGTTFYSYAWTGPSGYTSASEDISGLSAGSYSVTVTDAKGCTTTATISVTTFNDVTNPVINCPANITQSNDPGICGAVINYATPLGTDNCPGSVTTLTAGLSSGSTFNVGTTSVSYLVTDMAGNSASCGFTVTVNDVQLPVISCPSNVNVAADAGDCTADASSVNLGTPVTSDNCGISSVTNNAPGTFPPGSTTVTWTVTDVNGNSSTCTQTVMVSDSEFPVISSCAADLNTTSDNGACSATGISLGAPIVTDNCGIATITNNAPSFFPVGITTVTWTITDVSGNLSTCSQTVTISDSENPAVTVCQGDISTCDSLVTYAMPQATDNCGIASIVLTSGQASGTYFPIGTTNVVYTVTDVNGNISLCSFDVTVNPVPVLNVTIQNISCHNFNNGSIDLTVNSGTAPFSFTWSDSSSTEDISSLNPGSYSVTVIDANGCEAAIGAEITQPELLLLQELHFNIDCNGNNNGAIDLSITGGTFPYNSQWNTGDTTQDLTGLVSGNYMVYVSDQNGCNDSLPVFISQPDSLTITGISAPATCYGSNGILDITVSGGSDPYLFDWSEGTTTEDLVGFPSDTYTVTVTDSQGCVATYTDSIGTISEINLVAQTYDVKCNGESTGVINLLVLNATAPYTFTWSNGATTEDLDSLAAGSYTVTVMDANLCQLSVTIVINESPLLGITLTSPVDVNGFNVSAYQGSDGSVDLEITGGTDPYDILWNNGMTDPDLSSLPAGEYSVVVTDLNGCSVSAKIVLTQPFELAMPTGYTPNTDGQNDSFVVKGIEAYPDNEIQVYNRWGSIVYNEQGYANMWNGYNNNGVELPDGTYYVVLVLKQPGITLTGYVDMRRKR